MKAIILAAGQGTRLDSITSERPKCLVSVGGRTILERQIAALDRKNITEVWVVIGAKGNCWTQSSYEAVKMLCPRIVINFDNDRTHNAYSMYLSMAQAAEGDVLLLDGDVIFKDELLEQILSAHIPNFMVTALARSRSETGMRIVVDRQFRVVNLGKSLVPPQFPWDIHSGLIKISRESYSVFKECVRKKEYVSHEIEYPIRDFCKMDEMYILRTDHGMYVNVNTLEDLTFAQKIVS